MSPLPYAPIVSVRCASGCDGRHLGEPTHAVCPSHGCPPAQHDVDQYMPGLLRFDEQRRQEQVAACRWSATQSATSGRYAYGMLLTTWLPSSYISNCLSAEPISAYSRSAW